MLREEGYVQLHDFSQLLSAETTYIQQNMNLVALENAAVFRPVLQEVILRWRSAQQTLKLALGKEYTEHVAVPVGIAHHLSQEGRPISAAESHKIEKLIFSKRAKLTRGELEVLKSVATPYVAYVHENLVLRDKKKVPFIDWYDLEPFYRRCVIMPPPEERKLVERAMANARFLYDQVDLDLVRPASVYELVNLLKEKGH